MNSRKKGSDLLKLLLQIAVSFHVGAGNLIRALRKSSQCSQSRSLLSSPENSCPSDSEHRGHQRLPVYAESVRYLLVRRRYSSSPASSSGTPRETTLKSRSRSNRFGSCWLWKTCFVAHVGEWPQCLLHEVSSCMEALSVTPTLCLQVTLELFQGLLSPRAAKAQNSW